MTAPDPTAGEHVAGCHRYSGAWLCDPACPRDPRRREPRPAVAASTGTSEDEEALLDCECGHSLDEHNGLGCYARLSYEPLVQCSCALTDDRTHGELLAPRLATLLAAREAAARAEERERIAQAIEALPSHHLGVPYVNQRAAARIAREPRP